MIVMLVDISFFFEGGSVIYNFFHKSLEVYNY